jgi:hypothetical protein
VIRWWMVWWMVTPRGPAMTWPPSPNKTVLDRFANDVLSRRGRLSAARGRVVKMPAVGKVALRRRPAHPRPYRG